MAGYKRVNFYELCRLCASNQQKEKTHIFQEEGRKIQLQNKIQSCLSLKVCENDFLPKVVCSQCLQSLEECFNFKNGCVNSEAMLSSYFTNFRHTEDFKKSGKVYIKDTATKIENSSPLIVNVNNNIAVTTSKQEPQYYTVRVTTNEKNQKLEQSVPKAMYTTQPLAYNLNAINLAGAKSFSKADPLNNIIKIESEALNSIITNSNSNLRKCKTKQSTLNNIKNDKVDSMIVENNLIQIGLAQQEVTNCDDNTITNAKQDKIKTNQEPKYMYTFKIEEDKNTSFALNHLGQIQNFDNASSSILNLQTTNVPQNNINLNNNNNTGNNVKIEPETMSSNALKTTSTINTSVFNNLNLLPSNINLNGTNLNLVNMTNSNGTTNNNNSNNNNNLLHGSNLNGGNLMANNLISINQTNINLSNNINPPANNISTAIANNNNQNYNNGSQFATGNNNLNSTYDSNTTVNKNILANLAVISRISNLSRSKNKDSPPVPETNSINNANTFNTVIFNNNMPLSSSSSSSSSSSTTTTTTDNCNTTVNMTPTKQYMCEECKKVFKRREHLYQHVKLHTGYRPYVCENCNKSFMRKEHLSRHLISHSGQKNYTCEICEKSFSRNDNLLKHKKTHDKEQSYTCEICQKQFVMKHYYLAHKMAHEDEKVNFDIQKWNNLSV